MPSTFPTHELRLYYHGGHERKRVDRCSFDQEYVARLRDGDPHVQQHFTAYFGDLLLIKLRARLRSPQLIEDARQETFLRVLIILRRNGLENPERLGAFVNSICNNVVFEMFRAESRTLPITEDSPEPVDHRDDPEDHMISRSRKKQVNRVLEELPQKDRELLKQVFLDERDKDEVCRQFKIDRQYLRVLLHRAKSRFRALLAGEQQRTLTQHVR